MVDKEQQQLPPQPQTQGLARLLQKIGELGEEAEGMYRRALAIGEATHGPDDVQTGKIARGLARLILKRKR